MHAISEHFYVDTEKATAAQHAKQASWRITRFAAAYRGLHRELLKHHRAMHAATGASEPGARQPSPALLPPPGICLDEFG